MTGESAADSGAACTAPRKRWRLALALLIGVIVGAAGSLVVLRVTGSRPVEVSVAAPAPAQNEPVVAVASRLGPAVGTVINRGATATSLGSAFVFAHNSTVSFLITNNHVVAAASTLMVVMADGRSFTATLVGTDVLDDIAVVSVPDTTLTVATFGRSADVRAGQAVVAIGSPLGNDSSVTSGVISAPHRTISAGNAVQQSSETLQDVMQTDASINHGNSGGPLADMSGDVIGVNVAVAGNGTAIGYAIPADVARRVAEAIVAHTTVDHPYIGIAYYSAIDAASQGKAFNSAGVLVSRVTAGSPAGVAGFQAGDIITAVDGVTLNDGETLGGVIQTKHDGDTVAFSVRRGSQALTLRATLVERPTSVASP